MKAIRLLVPALGLLALAGCNTTSASQWQPVSTSKQGRFEQAKAICNGRAAETMTLAGRRWVAGLVASDMSFDGCMAQQGFVKR